MNLSAIKLPTAHAFAVTTRRFVYTALWLLPILVASQALATDVLFVGNSFTFGYNSYNKQAIIDANNSGKGGVPALFKKLADEGGFADVNVTIEAVGGQALSYHYKNKSAIIGKRWDYVVLQDYSTGPLTSHPAGNLTAFRQAVRNLNTLVKSRNASVRVLLYETWARPNLVPAAYPTLHAMQAELTAGYAGAVRDFALHDWAPVGSAFLRALDEGVAHDSKSVPAGEITLWAGDHYHANAYGAYLAALVFHVKILGGDPRKLPTGPDSAVAGLGLDPDHAKKLQEIAYLTTNRTSQRSPAPAHPSAE